MRTIERLSHDSINAPYQELALRIDYLTDCLYSAERRGAGVLEVENIKSEISYLMLELYDLETMAPY